MYHILNFCLFAQSQSVVYDLYPVNNYTNFTLICDEGNMCAHDRVLCPAYAACNIHCTAIGACSNVCTH